MNRKVREKALHLGGTKFTRMGLAAVKFYIAEDPLAIGGLGAVRVVVIPKHLPHLVH